MCAGQTVIVCSQSLVRPPAAAAVLSRSADRSPRGTHLLLLLLRLGDLKPRLRSGRAWCGPAFLAWPRRDGDFGTFSGRRAFVLCLLLGFFRCVRRSGVRIERFRTFFLFPTHVEDSLSQSKDSLGLKIPLQFGFLVAVDSLRCFRSRNFVS